MKYVKLSIITLAFVSCLAHAGREDLVNIQQPNIDVQSALQLAHNWEKKMSDDVRNNVALKLAEGHHIIKQGSKNDSITQFSFDDNSIRVWKDNSAGGKYSGEFLSSTSSISGQMVDRLAEEYYKELSKKYNNNK